MRTFFVEFIMSSPGTEPTTLIGKFTAESMNDAMALMRAYAKGARLGGKTIDITSLAAFKTRGREYEELF